MLGTSKNVVWQSSDGRVTSDHCRVTVQRLFSKFFLMAWNVQKTLFDSRPTVAWPQPLSRDRSATFFKICPNRLKRPKNVVWQSADGRVTSDHCRVTVQRLFSKIFSNCLKRPKNVVWQSADGRVTSTTVAWPFSDFFQNFPKSLETSKKRCLTVGRRSRDLNHCRVTVQRLFSKFSQIAWNVQKTLFDSRPTVAWPQPLSRDRSATFFSKNFPKSLETSKKRCLTVGRRSRDLRPLSRDRSATFFKIFPNRLKRPKNVVWQSADGRVTSTTVAWPFSDFLQNFPKSLETSKKRCLTVDRQSRDLLPLSRDRSATFFKKISNCLKRLKNVVWQSADGRVTSTTVAWPFSDFFQNFPKSLETS